eukprot:Pgem_evm2s10709
MYEEERKVIEECLSELVAMRKQLRKKGGTDFLHGQTQSLCKFFELRLEGYGKRESAEWAIESIDIDIKLTSWRFVSTWALSYMRERILPLSNRGKHRKILSLLMDEDIQERCAEFLRTCEQKERNPRGLKKFVFSNFNDK